MAKVLVVDGNEGIRSLLKDLLTNDSNQHEITTTDTTEEAQREIGKAHPPFDVVITGNWGLRNKGAELTFWIKEHYPETLVILMSALEEPGRHKADTFISKPFDLQQLEAAINQELAV